MRFPGDNIYRSGFFFRCNPDSYREANWCIGELLRFAIIVKN
jgi:hypothetical protein